MRKLAREIDLLTRLQDCSNVVQLINVLEDEDNAYLICELCRGGDLERILIVSPLNSRLLLLLTDHQRFIKLPNCKSALDSTDLTAQCIKVVVPLSSHLIAGRNHSIYGSA